MLGGGAPGLSQASRVPHHLRCHGPRRSAPRLRGEKTEPSRSSVCPGLPRQLPWGVRSTASPPVPLPPHRQVCVSLSLLAESCPDNPTCEGDSALSLLCCFLCCPPPLVTTQLSSARFSGLTAVAPRPALLPSVRLQQLASCAPSRVLGFQCLHPLLRPQPPASGSCQSDCCICESGFLTSTCK